MPAGPPWADLEAGLVSSITAFCALGDYASCRAVCSAWRAALPPPSSRPLAVFPADHAADHPVSLAACALHARRWTKLQHGGLHRPTWMGGGAARGYRCVGASRDGWIALVAGDAAAPAGPLLFNPFTGEEIPLDESLYQPAHELTPKIVFSPNPKRGDFTAVSLCRPGMVAVQRASDGCCHSEDTGLLLDGVVLVDMVYADNGKVYLLAKNGEVYVLHLSRRYRAGLRVRHRVWCQMPPMEVGTLLKVPMGANASPTPYYIISQFTDAKHLVLCDGELFQVWRRPSGVGSVTVDAPYGGAGRRIYIFEGDIFVLRYDPGNSPTSCWTVAEAKDLRGNAVFLGMNNAAVVRGKGLIANSVCYWDGPHGGRDYESVVYNMATRASVRWPAVSTGGAVSSPAWYFLPASGVDPEAETTGVEAASKEGATSAEHNDEDEHSAHCLKKTMNLLGRLNYCVLYSN